MMTEEFFEIAKPRLTRYLLTHCKYQHWCTVKVAADGHIHTASHVIAQTFGDAWDTKQSPFILSGMINLWRWNCPGEEVPSYYSRTCDAIQCLWFSQYRCVQHISDSHHAILCSSVISLHLEWHLNASSGSGRATCGLNRNKIATKCYYLQRKFQSCKLHHRCTTEQWCCILFYEHSLF